MFPSENTETVRKHSFKDDQWYLKGAGFGTLRSGKKIKELRIVTHDKKQWTQVTRDSL